MGLIMWVWGSGYMKLMLVSSPVIYYLVLGQDISPFELADWVQLATQHAPWVSLSLPFPTSNGLQKPTAMPSFYMGAKDLTS